MVGARKQRPKATPQTSSSTISNSTPTTDLIDPTRVGAITSDLELLDLLEMEPIEEHTSTIAIPRLSSWKDWEIWYDTVQSIAEEEGIWHLVDPNGDDNVIPLKEPIEPEGIEDRDALSRAQFAYNNAYRRWQSQRRALHNLDKIVRSSLDRQCMAVILGTRSTKERLLALQDDLKPTIEQVQDDLRLEYEALGKAPWGRTVEHWIKEWRAFDRRARKTQIRAITQYDLALQLNSSVDPILHTEVTLRRMDLSTQRKNGVEVYLRDEINNWVDLLRDQKLEKFPAKGPTTTKAAFSATLQNRIMPNNQGNNINEDRIPGRYNGPMEKNYYLNPEYPRPEGWIVNPGMVQRWKKYLQSHPEYYAASQEAIQKWKTSSKEPESPKRVVMTANSNQQDSDDLSKAVILDGGANIHVINRAMQHRITKTRPAEGEGVQTGTEWIEATAVVDATVFLELDGEKREVVMKDALYIPTFTISLISAGKLATVSIYHDLATPNYLLYEQKSRKRIPWANVTMRGTIVVLEANVQRDLNLATSTMSVKHKPLSKSPGQWHRLLAHPGNRAIEKLLENTTDCEFDSSTNKTVSYDCDACCLSKMKAQISRRPDKHREASILKEEQLLSIVSWDIIEFTEAIDGSKYLSHFYYDNESYHAVYPVATKAQAVAQLEAHFTMMKTRFGAKTVFFRCDNETSLGKQGLRIIAKEGITRLPSAIETPAQNGSAEASGKAIVQAARTLRIAAKLPKDLWPWLCQTAAYLLNRTPTKKLGYKTPFEMTTGKLPSLGHLRVIGSKAYALDKKIGKRDKLQEKAHIGYLLGYDGTRIFYVWIPTLSQVIRTRDVVFREELYNPTVDITLGKVLDQRAHQQVISTITLPEESSIQNPNPYLSANIPTFRFEKKASSEPQQRIANEGYPTPSPTGSPSPAPSQEDQEEQEEQEEETFYDALSGGTEDFMAMAASLARRATPVPPTLTNLHRDQAPAPPTSWQELQEHQFRANFEQAMKTEYNALSGTTFTTVSDYEGYLLPLKWVWTYKYDEKGFITKFKARLCVRGDLQLPQIQDNYAATLAMKTFRALMALMCAFDLDSRAYDMVNAFCNANLETPIYCTLPKGYEQPGKALKLTRALYGLQESPKLWYRTLKGKLEEFGLEEVQGTECLMTGKRLIVFFYVDDMIVLHWAQDRQIANEFERHLTSAYNTKVLGPAAWFLGIEIIRDRVNKKLWLSQSSYCEKVAARFGADRVTKTPSIPLPDDLSTIRNEKQASTAQIKGYQMKIGSIGYAAIATRPDIAKAFSILSQFNQNPSGHHIMLADHLISYLYGTKGQSLMYDGVKPPWEVFCDASFADNEDRKSSQGLLFKMFGGAVDWKANKQRTVTTSTTEAELLALSAIGSHIYGWNRLFQGINFDTGLIPTVYCDNTQACRIANGETTTATTKLRHVDIHQHWIRQEVQQGRIKVNWVPTVQQEADGLTKLLPRQKFEEFTRQLGLQGGPLLAKG